MTRFIAEIGSNHNGSLERALQLVSVAKSCGFDAVKVQVFDTDKMFRLGTITTAKHFPCPLEWIRNLHDLAQSLGMDFGATLFDVGTTKSGLIRHYMDFVKCSSYDVLRHDLIRALVATKKPLILSTGMATLDEVKAAATFIPAGATLMHTVSIYPCPPWKANLSRIARIRSMWTGPVGYSDHTVDADIVTRAVLTWGAVVVELHLDLEDCQGVETAHSAKPYEANIIIKDCSVDGDGTDHPTEEEQAERHWRCSPYDGMRPVK